MSATSPPAASRGARTRRPARSKRPTSVVANPYAPWQVIVVRARDSVAAPTPRKSVDYGRAQRRPPAVHFQRAARVDCALRRGVPAPGNAGLRGAADRDLSHSPCGFRAFVVHTLPPICRRAPVTESAIKSYVLSPGKRARRQSLWQRSGQASATDPQADALRREEYRLATLQV